MYNIAMVGIFGGAFDPLHCEHLNMAVAARYELGLERLVLVPTYNPPHKDNAILSFEDRVAILRGSFEVVAKGCKVDVVVSEIEKTSGCDKNYIVDTLKALKEQYGDIVYLIGGDSFEKFDTWYRPDEILKLARLAVCERDGYEGAKAVKKTLLEKYDYAKIDILEYKGKFVSSTQVKVGLYMGLSQGKRNTQIPEFADEYIKQHKLFSQYDSFMPKLVDMLRMYGRLGHSVRVAETALEINQKCNLGLDFNEVLLASALHDCGKHSTKYRALSPKDAVDTKVEHQFESASIAEIDFGVTNKSVLDAIRTHTTAEKNMTTLQKLVYIADIVEPSRDMEFTWAPELRNAIYEDFEKGFRLGLKMSYEHLKEKEAEIYPLTVEAYKWYIIVGKN